jgi:hypothetical protein
MRITSTLFCVVLFGLTVSARAQEAPTTVESHGPLNQVEQLGTKPPSSVGKVQIGVAFLSMGLGKMTQVLKGVREDNDALFAYGLGLAVDYRILPGFTVGFAPQAILNVKAKDSSLNAARQIDLLARVAYAYPIAEGSRIYAEVLPGYSLIITDDLSKGLVIAIGAGVVVDVTARTFVNFGLGYQRGFQKFEGDDNTTSYVRAALGGGSRF